MPKLVSFMQLKHLILLKSINYLKSMLEWRRCRFIGNDVLIMANTMAWLSKKDDVAQMMSMRMKKMILSVHKLYNKTKIRKKCKKKCGKLFCHHANKQTDQRYTGKSNRNIYLIARMSCLIAKTPKS